MSWMLAAICTIDNIHSLQIIIICNLNLNQMNFFSGSYSHSHLYSPEFWVVMMKSATQPVYHNDA